MIPVEPVLHEGGKLIKFAEHQPEYVTLPASVDAHGTVMTEWELTAEELDKLCRGGRLRLWIMYTKVNHPTTPEPLTPVMIEVVQGEHDGTVRES